MKRPPAWLLRRRMLERPRALRPEPVTTINVFGLNSGVNADEQLMRWLKKNIRRDGGNPGVFG